MNMKNVKNLVKLKVAVIGIGYVGLPLSVVFGENTLALGVSFGVSVIAYGALYACLPQLRWCFSAATLNTAVVAPTDFLS